MVSVRSTAVVVSAVTAAVVVYAVMWLGFRQGWSWLSFLDSKSLASLHGVGVKHPSWVRFWEVVSVVFGPAAFRLLGAAAVVVVAVKRKLRAAVFL
ncbi:MAG: phosphatase PAP2 family protein, partial [Mycobacterium sp.]